MHIPVNITITCNRNTQVSLRDYLLPNRLIHVIDIHTDYSATSDMISIVVVGIIFDHEDAEFIKKGLANFGTVNLIKGR
jgi:hypothetical protein